MHFEESCPCGGKINVSGYTSEVRAQAEQWRSLHNRHATAIAKAMAEKANWPIYYVPSPPAPGAAPWPWQQPIVTFTTTTETNSARPETQK